MNGRHRPKPILPFIVLTDSTGIRHIRKLSLRVNGL